MSARNVGLLGVISAIWGGSYLLIQIAVESFSPAMVVCGRLVVASLVLGIALKFSSGLGSVRLAMQDLRNRPGKVVLLAFVSIVIPFMLITVGQLIAVPSSLAAILIAPMPLFIAVMAPFVDHSEKVHKAGAIGLIVGFLGVVLVVGVDAVSSWTEFLGALALLGACVSYSVAPLLAKNSFKALKPTETSFVSILVSAIVTLPAALITAPGTAWVVGPILAVVCLGGFATALAFVIYYRLVTEIGAGRASLVSYVAPVFALFYGAVLAGETITIAAVAGLVLILGGTAFSARQNRSGARPVAKTVSNEAHAPSAVSPPHKRVDRGCRVAEARRLAAAECSTGANRP